LFHPLRDTRSSSLSAQPEIMPGKGIAAAVGVTGVILVWSGVENRSVLSVVRDLIAGKKPAPGPGTAITDPATAALGSLAGSAGNAATPSDAQNEALGRLLAAPYGWSAGAEWTALNNIVMAESGWNVDAQNPDSSAAGIAQNINGYSAGYQAGNATSQINWMLAYIKQRYGDPITAWQFHQANGWY
jgi:hypothetical protein